MASSVAKAAAVAVVAGVVVRFVARFALRAVPEGPKLYWVRASDVRGPGVPKIARWRFLLLGVLDAVTGSKWESGLAHILFTQRAREVVGHKDAHAAGRVLWNHSVLITNPDDIMYVLVDNSHDFRKQDITVAVVPVFGHNGLPVIIDEDKHTEQARKVAPAFAPRVVRDVTESTINRRAAAALGAIATGTLSTLEDTTQWCTDLALGVIREAAFKQTDPKPKPAVEAFSKRMEFKVPMWAFFLPPWLYLRLPLPRLREDAKARADLLAFLKPLISEMRAHGSAEPAGHKKLLDLLAERVPQLTDVEILDHSATFVLGGHDTTANAMAWALYFLARNPDIQELLCEELADYLAFEAVPAIDTLRKVQLLDAVVCETLRLRSPILGCGRCCVSDHVLPSGTYLPRGTSVEVPCYAMHRDPSAWGDDAEVFRPARWVEDPGLKERVNGTYFVPFGLGKRACIGREFAMNELMVAVALVVRRFHLSYPDGQDEVRRDLKIVVRPDHKFAVTFTPRSAA